jgi:hypothetical protein
LKIGSKTLKEDKADEQKNCGQARFALHLETPGCIQLVEVTYG